MYGKRSSVWSIREKQRKLIVEEKNLMSISAFSKMTGIKRANLIFYDKIGLLSPYKKGSDNRYRYYSRHQLDYAYLISGLRELGISLPEIKAYADTRTPRLMVELFRRQSTRIDEEIQKLTHLREMMELHIQNALTIPYEKIGTVFLMQKEPEPIFTGPTLTSECKEDEALTSFYELLARHRMASGYPLGAAVRFESLKLSPDQNVSYYYCRQSPEPNAMKAGGLYAIIYEHCPYSESDAAYEKLAAFLKKEGYRIQGDVYEEYPLNELALQNPDDYCVRLEVLVTNG